MRLSVTRLLAAFMALAATVGAASGAPVAAGSALKTYTDSARYVTFQYPANWALSTTLSDLTTHAGALGLKSSALVYAPDNLAFFGVGVKPSLSTASQERAAAVTLLKENTSIIGAISFTTLAPQYGPRLAAKAQVRVDAQRTGIELLVIGDENKHKTVYAIELLMRKPSAPDAEARQLANVFTSLVVG